MLNFLRQKGHVRTRMEKLIIGYTAASEFTGIGRRQLQKMVQRRSIRAIRLYGRSVAFSPSKLAEDLQALETKKLVSR